MQVSAKGGCGHAKCKKVRRSFGTPVILCEAVRRCPLPPVRVFMQKVLLFFKLFNKRTISEINVGETANMLSCTRFYCFWSSVWGWQTCPAQPWSNPFYCADKKWPEKWPSRPNMITAWGCNHSQSHHAEGWRLFKRRTDVSNIINSIKRRPDVSTDFIYDTKTLQDSDSRYYYYYYN